MRRYLIAAISVAAVSLILVLLSLLGLWGYDLLGLSIVSKFAPNGPLPDQAAYVQAIASVASAIATSFALIVGAIAIIAVVENEKSEHKAVEQTKVDFASLASLALTIRNRAFLYTNPKIVDREIDLFGQERQRLVEILCGPTGLAISLWRKKDEHQELTNSDLFVTLCGLVDSLTLDRTENLQDVLFHIAKRAGGAVIQLSTVDEGDFSTITKVLSDMGKGLKYAAELVRNDPFAILLRSMNEARDSGYRAPTQDEVDILVALAQDKVGGKSGDLVRSFGDKAISGTNKDRASFHKLIDQLLGERLSDLPSQQEL